MNLFNDGYIKGEYLMWSTNFKFLLDTEWAVMKYEENALKVTKKGTGFDPFKKCFGPADRGYGYIRIIGGVEVSKRP